MIGDILKTIGQIDDPRFLKVVLKSVVISMLMFGLLWALVAFVLTQIDLLETVWLERLIDILGGLVVIALTIALFPAVAIMTVGFFLEEVCATVEARHYRNLPPPRQQSITETVRTSVRLGITVLAINIVLLPAYLLLIFIPPANIVLYYTVNGYLVGREYFELVALRRVPPDIARNMRRRHRGGVWLVGIIIAFLFTIPLIGLLVPGLGAAMMLHTYQRRMREREY